MAWRAFDDGMKSDPVAVPPADAAAPLVTPSLVTLAWVFMLIGMQSFGGGLSAWMRREAVQRRRWMSDTQFASGMALCQIAPGPNSVNLSVFIGTTLRGRMGALAALVGMLVVPVAVVLTMGGLFARVQGVAAVNSAMVGLGAGAIGMTVLILLYPERRLVQLVGSDIAHAVPLTLIAGLGHWAVGSVNFGLLAALLCGSLPGVLLGSAVSARIPEWVLRPVLAVVLLVVGGRLVV